MSYTQDSYNALNQRLAANQANPPANAVPDAWKAFAPDNSILGAMGTPMGQLAATVPGTNYKMSITPGTGDNWHIYLMDQNGNRLYDSQVTSQQMQQWGPTQALQNLQMTPYTHRSSNILSDFNDMVTDPRWLSSVAVMAPAIIPAAGAVAAGTTAAQAGAAAAGAGAAGSGLSTIPLAEQPLAAATPIAAGGTAGQVAADVAGAGASGLGAGTAAAPYALAAGSGAAASALNPTTAAILGSSVISGGLGYKASQDAGKASQAATDAAIAEQRRQFDINQQNQAPYLQAGRNALNTLTAATKAPTNAFSNPAFQFDPSQIKNDPAYKFAYDQAMQAVTRGTNAGGFAGSGNQLTALQDRAAGLASQQYQNAFNNQFQTYGANSANNLTNYNVNYGANQDYLNRLASEAGIGQTAANQVGATGANMAGNIGNAFLQNGSNQANAMMNGYGSINNAIQGGVGNYLSYLTQQQLMSRLPQYTSPYGR